MRAPLRILILEDVPMDAELVEYELGRASVDFDARRVDTRDAFERQLEEFRPDVILSDYTLPRFDGMAALSLARERAPDIPFLIVTGSVNEETAVGCMKAGATDYLLKSNLARIGPAIEGALARVRSRTEKSRAEEALQRSEANLRAIFNNSLQAFVLVDRDGRIKALNRTAEEWGALILGRQVHEGERIEQFIPDAGQAFRDALAGESRTTERCIRGRDGIERWFETTHAPVVDERGQVIGVCLNARDVSERKAGEQALRESEARYRDLFDNASDLVCMTSPRGEFLYVNRAWHDVTGYTDAELAGRLLLDIVHASSRERYEELQRRALAGETLTHAELTLVPSEGIPVTVEGNISAVFRDGVPVAIRGIYRDITERKRIEDQLRRAERMQAAGRLAGGVAHEVNNMMTGVIGFSEFLMRSLDPEDPRRVEVREIIKAGTRAADITRQLLAFTRQQFMRAELLNVNDIISGMEKLLRRSLGENHELELRLADTIGEIRADRGHLEQVLLNLVLNARDAIQDRGQVVISTGRASREEVQAARHVDVDVPAESYVRLAVSDTGCGMDPEVQARIFEPFFTTKGVGQGTGLGLSTVYGIVKQSGGFVWVESEVGQGSTFSIYLPRVEAPDRDMLQQDMPADSEGGTETILVVEDEPMVRDLACRGLREKGYTVLEAANGAEALEALADQSKPVDLVISDVVMPKVGGRELGLELARLEPELPVLYMSGYTGDDVIQRGLLDPDAPFQQKPFSPEALARKVREMLDLRRSPRSPRQDASPAAASDGTPDAPPGG
jgi:PAS domain S-box-containing protein